jgi:hypothetical protein
VLSFHDSPPLAMETLELRPLILQINGFLTDAEAGVDEGLPSLSLSNIIHMEIPIVTRDVSDE